MKITHWISLVFLFALCGCERDDSGPGHGAATDPGPICPGFRLAADGLPDQGEWRSHPSVGDVNGDGLGDFSALARKGNGPHVFLSDGLGGWTDRSDDLLYKREFSCGIGTHLGHLNGDAHLDLAIADHCMGVLAYRGDGAGGWTAASSGIPRNQQGFNDVDSGDVDADGWPDMIAISAFSRGFMALAGGPDGRWRHLRDTGLPDVGSGFQIHLVDVNADGMLDVVSSYSQVTAERRTAPPEPAKVWLQEQPWRFRPAPGFPADGRFIGADTWPRADGSGSDVFFTVTGRFGGVYRYDETAALVPPDTQVDPSDVEPDPAWKNLTRIDHDWFDAESVSYVGLDLDDLDADGCADMLITGGIDARPRLAMGDCAGGFAICPDDTLPIARLEPVWGITAGDVNGDGRLDVVAAFGGGSIGGLKAWLQTAPPGAPAEPPTD